MLGKLKTEIQRRRKERADSRRRLNAMRRVELLKRKDLTEFLDSLREEFPEAYVPAKDYLEYLANCEESDKILFLGTLQRIGRIESYHHFLGALVYPIILHHVEFGFEPGTELQILDCGNLNPHIEGIARHLGLGVRFFPSEISDAILQTNSAKVLWLPPFDGSNESDKWLNDHEISELRSFFFDFSPQGDKPKIPVLMISRGESDSFFSSQRFQRFYAQVSEWNHTGASRRHLLNEPEIVAQISEVADVHVAVLEDADLALQVDLFRRAEIVIGQHGAGLNGLIWCAPGSSVLEILPRDKLGNPSTYFRNIARRLGLRHTYLIQSGPHDPVDASSIMRFVQQRLNRG